MSIILVYGLSGSLLQISPIYLLIRLVSLEWGSIYVEPLFFMLLRAITPPFFSLLLFFQSSLGFWGVIPGVFQGSLPACRNCQPPAISWVSLTVCPRTSLLDYLYFFLIGVLHGGNLSFLTPGWAWPAHRMGQSYYGVLSHPAESGWSTPRPRTLQS